MEILSTYVKINRADWNLLSQKKLIPSEVLKKIRQYHEESGYPTGEQIRSCRS